MNIVLVLHFTHNIYFTKQTFEFRNYKENKYKEKYYWTEAKQNITAQDLSCSWRCLLKESIHEEDS
jgi:hypothetical protein